jgi:hypothetical protein
MRCLVHSALAKIILKVLHITDSRSVLFQIIAEYHLYTAGKAFLNNVRISHTTKKYLSDKCTILLLLKTGMAALHLVKVDHYK